MALVWQYGEKSGFESWKGLSWGMVSYSSCYCRFDVAVHLIECQYDIKLVNL